MGGPDEDEQKNEVTTPLDEEPPKSPIKIDEKDAEWLLANPPAEITINSRRYFPKVGIASGMKGVVWRALNQSGRPVAIKAAVAEDYQEKRVILQEEERADALTPYSEFARLIGAEMQELDVAGTKKHFACFAEEWVEGPTLDEFLKKPGAASVPFLDKFVHKMCQVLNALEVEGLCHDDLKGDNIKIGLPPRGELTDNTWVLKVIDLGSLKKRPSTKPVDDHGHFIRHVIKIANEIQKHKSLRSEEKLYLTYITPILNKMVDPDPQARLSAPAAIVRQFEAALKRARSPPARAHKLASPFDYISAEFIHDDSLLVTLFAESCPWKNEILGPDPLVLTGPRGCGKSTLFRRVSIRGMMCKGPDEVSKSRIAGFYISCSTDLKNRVNWINTDELALKYAADLVHYFNLVLTREVVYTLRTIADDEKARVELFGFGPEEERDLHRFILDALEIDQIERRRLQGVPPMAHLLELVETEMERAHRAMVRGQDVGPRTTLPYVASLSDFLNKNVRYFRDRKIVYFVDDLSVRQIPRAVQAVLNDIILLERPRSHVFKISTDKYGWTGVSITDAHGDRQREFREIDCSIRFLSSLPTKRIEFTTELLRNRLREAKYEGTPEQIIGHSAYERMSLGREIRWRTENNKGINDIYHGIETITDLCCGDIANLLELFHRVFQEGKVGQATTGRVEPRLQNKAIVATSARLLENIRAYHPNGPKLHEIAKSFGAMTNKITRYGKKQAGDIPNETSHIDIEDDPKKKPFDLSDKHWALHEDLVNHSVFIELQSSRSRRTFGATHRLQLRPLLIPTLGGPLSKNVPIKWTREEYRYFLEDPQGKCKLEYETRFKPPPPKDDDDDDDKGQSKLDLGGP